MPESSSRTRRRSRRDPSSQDGDRAYTKDKRREREVRHEDEPSIEIRFVRRLQPKEPVTQNVLAQLRDLETPVGVVEWDT